MSDGNGSGGGAGARLGILFVHGIGDQPQGATLVQFAEPIVRWIERRAESLPGRLIDAGVTRSELDRWQEAVLTAWLAAGRDDLLRWKPLLWRLLVDTYLDASRNERRAGTPAADAIAPVDAGARLVEFVEKYSRVAPAVVAQAEVADGNLRPGPDTPAHARLHLRAIGLDGTISQTTWLLAESWWAGAFSTLSFRDLIGISPALVPAVVGLHFGAGLRRAWRPTAWPVLIDLAVRSVRVVLSVVALIVGLILAVVAIAGLFMIYPLALLPVAALRSFATGVQRLLTATLGDSYVLVTSPVRTAAILSRLRSDLEWLAPQCDTIAIVAHSQGAALTYLLLQQATSDTRLGERPEDARTADWLHKLELLFTFGSGLRKLAEMERLRARDSRHVWMYAPLAVLGPLSLFGLIDSISNGTAELISVLVSVFVIVLAGLAIYGFAHGTAASGLKYWTSELREVFTLRWVDHFASADPVPHGALLDGDYPSAIRTFNRGSVLTDHTSYWQNQDQFISSVAAALGALEGGTVQEILETPPKTMARVVSLRRLRVIYLTGARWLMLAAAGVAVATHRAEWALLAEWARQKAASWAVAVLPSEFAWEVTVSARPTLAIVAATAGWLVALAAVYHAVFLVWRWWESEEVELFFSGSRRDDPSKRMMAFLASGLAPLAVTLWLCLPELFQAREQVLLGAGLGVVVIAAFAYLRVSRRRPAVADSVPSASAQAAGPPG